MCVLGTRPEIIKLAPVIWEMQRRHVRFLLVHSGQHYDFNLSQQFLKELRLPKPDYSIQLRNARVIPQLSEIISRLGPLLERTRPEYLLVEGDTNTVLAAGIAANKAGIPLAHVEAGLRSYDLRMPEEHNRRIVDHLSTYLFAPTAEASRNLEREHVWGDVVVTGNTVIDACLQHLPIALDRAKTGIHRPDGRFALATVHRAENVDDKTVLRNFVAVFKEAPIRIVLPLHPRTKKRLAQFGLLRGLLAAANVDVIEPVGYLDFLALIYHCELILTDSGGIQEEATAPGIRKRVLVLRESTERPEAVRAGFVRVVGCKKKEILRHLSRKSLGSWKTMGQCPYGDGNAAKRIIAHILEQ
jgi:UDP-N-acetylglucosamine 2-epimerase (non-hydrolysing)